MRRRLAHALLALSATLAWCGVARSQQASEEYLPPAPTGRVVSESGAIEDLSDEGGILPVHHCTDCTFSDTMSAYDETCAVGANTKLMKFKQHVLGRKFGKCSSCDASCGEECGGSCGPSCGNGCGGGALAGIGRCLAAKGIGNGDCEDYECANCYSRWDCEKRLYIGYVAGNATKASTRLGPNDLDGAQVGAEFLPWVCQDGSEFFARMGFTVMWQYSHFRGGAVEGQLESDLTGGLISVDSGQMHSFIIAPTYRVDFDIFGIRLSPNASMGMTFDWIDLQPTAPVGGRTAPVEEFKFTGFDAGYYGKWALDFGITEKINFSIGMDFRASTTDVMQDSGDLRKHLGLVIGMSHTF